MARVTQNHATLRRKWISDNRIMEKPITVIVNNSSNIWILILVALIGALAVLTSAFVAIRGQREPHRSDAARQLRREVSAAVADTINYVGAAGSVVHAMARGDYGRATVDSFLDRTNDLYPQALKSITMVVSASDSEISKQAESLYSALVTMASDIMRKSQGPASGLAKDFADHKSTVDREWNVLLQQTKVTDRLKSGKKPVFLSVSEATAAFEEDDLSE